MDLSNLRTEYVGRKIFEYDEIDSTQLEAKRKAEDTILPNGSVFFAKRQTAGKGTHGRKWYTDGKDSLAFTIVLFPNCDITAIDGFTKKIAVCMVNTIKKLYGYDISIKEPNDLVFDNKKLGGILTECVSEGNIIKKLFVGIGMNINQLQFPKEIENIAISLKQAFDTDFNATNIFVEFCNEFEKILLK